MSAENEDIADVVSPVSPISQSDIGCMIMDLRGRIVTADDIKPLITKIVKRNNEMNHMEAACESLISRIEILEQQKKWRDVLSFSVGR